MYQKPGLKFTYYSKYSREQWLALRNHVQGYGAKDRVAFGGSDIGCILDIDRYKSPGELFYQVTGYTEYKSFSNIEMYRGQILEPVIYNHYFKYYDPFEPSYEKFLENAQMGKVVRKATKVNAIIQNEAYPYLFANIDYEICRRGYPQSPGFPYYKFSGKNGVLELKSMAGYAMDCWESGIAPTYLFQHQGYMLICEKEWGELFVLKDATYPVCFPMTPNDEMVNLIITRVEDFAKRVLEVKKVIYSKAPQDEKDHAVAQYEPPVSGNPAWTDWLKQKRSERELQGSKEGSPEEYNLAVGYLLQGEKAKEIEHTKNHYGNLLKKSFLDFGVETIDFGALGKVSWKEKFNVPNSLLKKYRETEA